MKAFCEVISCCQLAWRECASLRARLDTVVRMSTRFRDGTTNMITGLELAVAHW
jgi:cobalamin biosynthesis Mg chelatase CobN